MKPLISILLLTTYLFCFSGCEKSDANINTTDMNQQIYTLGVWHVQAAIGIYHHMERVRRNF